MRQFARSLVLSLAMAPLLLAGAWAGGGTARVVCTMAEGTDPALGQALCDALRNRHDGAPLRLHVLTTGPAALGARLDLLKDQGPRLGPVLEFSVMDRALTPDDFQLFARDLLRFGLPQP